MDLFLLKSNDLFGALENRLAVLHFLAQIRKISNLDQNVELRFLFIVIIIILVLICQLMLYFRYSHGKLAVLQTQTIMIRNFRAGVVETLVQTLDSWSQNAVQRDDDDVMLGYSTASDEVPRAMVSMEADLEQKHGQNKGLKRRCSAAPLGNSFV